METATINLWPTLEYPDLKDTLATVHLWTQIVGKVRLRKMPWTNHSWHVTLAVSPTGLTSGAIPNGTENFQIDFDFIKHQLIITTSEGGQESFQLTSISVALFYKTLFAKLNLLNIDAYIYASPNEVEVAIPFQQDEIHRTYDPGQIQPLWKALLIVNNIFLQFRARFMGKCSPVHFFWGAFDLAVTRFSGRKAPLHSGGAPNIPLRVMQESYSHEVSSCGFWPGNEQFPHPCFYSYCYPSPDEFSRQLVEPSEAFFSPDMGEFILKYDDVRKSPNPQKNLFDFLQTTYEAAARAGEWNRELLDADFSGFEK
ncbi:MAG: DUF5996 family protein [Ginsengibacter sp.]